MLIQQIFLLIFLFAYGIFPQIQHDALPCGACDPPCDRGRMGQGRHRGFAEVFRLHRVEHQGQADEFRVHRNDRRLPESASEAGRTAVKYGLAKKQKLPHSGRSCFFKCQRYMPPLGSSPVHVP